MWSLWLDINPVGVYDSVAALLGCYNHTPRTSGFHLDERTASMYQFDADKSIAVTRRNVRAHTWKLTFRRPAQICASPYHPPGPRHREFPLKLVWNRTLSYVYAADAPPPKPCGERRRVPVPVKRTYSTSASWTPQSGSRRSLSRYSR